MPLPQLKESVRNNQEHREQAQAELTFEKYMYQIFTLASAELPHAEGQSH